jgi:hypothetical protein
MTDAPVICTLSSHCQRTGRKQVVSGKGGPIAYRLVEFQEPTAKIANSSDTGAEGAGGGDRDRTDDLLLAKQALSQLSYTPGDAVSCQLSALNSSEWWAREDLNLRPHAYQARALTN